MDTLFFTGHRDYLWGDVILKRRKKKPDQTVEGPRPGRLLPRHSQSVYMSSIQLNADKYTGPKG